MKRIAIEVGLCLVCCLCSVMICVCFKHSANKAKEEAESAEQEAKDAEDRWIKVEERNRELLKVIEQYNDAVIKNAQATEEAVVEYEKRNNKILCSDSNWLDERIPDSVRDAFCGGNSD